VSAVIQHESHLPYFHVAHSAHRRIRPTARVAALRMVQRADGVRQLLRRCNMGCPHDAILVLHQRSPFY
jgi:hypothetical protein